MEGLRIESLEAEHFKNIDKKIVNIGGRSFIITGKNGAGKSSIIQAILSPMDSKVKQPAAPIKKGEEKAYTKVVIAGEIGGEPLEYTLEMFYTPGNQTGRLVVKNSKGEAIKSPAKTLDSIIGNISFDMFKFLNSTQAAKAKILKEVAGVTKEVDKLDADRKKSMEDRLYKSKQCAEKEAIMKNHGLSQDQIDKYSEEIPVEPIQDELSSISKKIESWSRIKNGVDGYKKNIEEYKSDISENEKRIKELEKEIEERKQANEEYKKHIATCEDNIEKGNAWLAKNPEPKADEISKRLSEANLHNEKCREVVELGKKQLEIIQLKKDIDKLDADIKKIDESKTRLFSKCKLPVEGLTIQDDAVFLNGLPLEEGQINTAELYKVGFEISKALNPNLRVLIIPEGSLFDRESLMKVIEDADADGYQVIAEVVSDDADVSINFIEEEA